MKKALIGYTGFVGSNLAQQIDFDDYYNSKNITEIIKKSYDFIICAGIRAEKYLANKYPDQDLTQINKLITLLDTIECGHFVLISTIDVYNNTIGVDENTEIDETSLHAYGKNRLYMEKWIKQKFEKHTIIRLPALFGKGLKKNFIYDCMTKIPSIIMRAKYLELTEKVPNEIIQKCYTEDENGNYAYDIKTCSKEKKILIHTLETQGFTSLVFTDSRSMFPFYDLSKLSEHIEIATVNDISLINFVTKPILAKEVAKQVFNIEFENEIENKPPVIYNIKTKFDSLFGGVNGYIYNKQQVIEQIKKFAGTAT